MASTLAERRYRTFHLRFDKNEKGVETSLSENFHA
jgi:hypothetical protein